MQLYELTLHQLRELLDQGEITAAQRKALGITETEDIPDLTEELIQVIKRRHKPTGAKGEQ